MANSAKIISPAYRGKVAERAMCVSSGFSDQNMMKLECHFYSKLAQKLCTDVGVPVPKIYYTGMSGHHNFITTGLFIAFGRREHICSLIVMEDLTAAKFVPSLIDVQPREMDMILTASAKMHAHSAKLFKQSLNGLPYCFHAELVTMSSGLLLHVKKILLGSSSGRLTKRVKRRWGDKGYSCLNDQDVFDSLASLEKNYKRTVYPLMNAMYKRFPCFVHGDLHAGNFAYLPDGSIRMLDFQMYGWGSPAWELQYFLNFNVEPGNPEKDEQIIRDYHAALELHSGMSYPYALFRRDVDLSTLDCCAMTLVRQAYFDSPSAMAKEMKTFMKVYVEETRVTVTAIDLKLIQRTKEIWLRDKDFKMDLQRYEAAIKV